jgi:hypothetical protein
MNKENNFRKNLVFEEPQRHAAHGGASVNEPLPPRIRNTMSLGYVRKSLRPQFLPSGMPAWKTEHGVEFNALLVVLPMLLPQPVVQYYANGGRLPARRRVRIQDKDRVLGSGCGEQRYEHACHVAHDESDGSGEI